MPKKNERLKPSNQDILKNKADELAIAVETRDKLDEVIVGLRADILTLIGPLSDPHTMLRGHASQWDLRSLPVATVAWKAIAEHMKPPQALIEQHTTKRMQISFKRVPVEVSP